MFNESFKRKYSIFVLLMGISRHARCPLPYVDKDFLRFIFIYFYQKLKNCGNLKPKVANTLEDSLINID